VYYIKPRKKEQFLKSLMPNITIKSKPEQHADNYIANLFAVLTKLTPGQLMLLYGDLFTETEAVKLAKRLEIARGLLSGQSYKQIQKALGVTANTVVEIQRVLKSAGNGFRSAANWLALTGKSEQHISSFGEQLVQPVRSIPEVEVKRTLIGGVLEKLFRFPSQQQKKVFEKN
jgi:uncharacterized protein YerC